MSWVSSGVSGHLKTERAHARPDKQKGMVAHTLYREVPLDMLGIHDHQTTTTTMQPRKWWRLGRCLSLVTGDKSQIYPSNHAIATLGPYIPRQKPTTRPPLFLWVKCGRALEILLLDSADLSMEISKVNRARSNPTAHTLVALCIHGPGHGPRLDGAVRVRSAARLSMGATMPHRERGGVDAGPLADRPRDTDHSNATRTG